jgi:uncharacterized protein (TIGR00299 family) protein
MRILYYDCFSGISGDMNLGAMIDLGVDPEYLRGELRKLGVDGYTLTFTPDQRKGISGTRADVTLEGHHSHSHAFHSHSQRQHVSLWERLGLTRHHHNHHHSSHRIHKHGHEHGRNFSDIKTLIAKSTLSERVKELSLRIFTLIAEAEGKIHGKAPELVHFHEVGAVDSIVDIVGAAICIDFLKPDKIIMSPVELGGGFVKCEHGMFPVPAPATLEIVKNLPVKTGAVNVETTTPTGAAILAALTKGETANFQMIIDKIAYGIGHRDNAIPNVLRVCLAHLSVTEIPEESTRAHSSKACVVECNIDDLNPEMYEHIMEKLFETGADDVWMQSIIMKKSRPGIKLSALCSPTLSEIIGQILFTHTSTLGYRVLAADKKMLERSWQTLETRWGSVRIKQGILDGKVIKSKPEYEDCLKISRENNIPLIDVYNEIKLKL